MKKKHPGGRPTVMTPEAIRKLEEGFSKGLNVIECTLFAGISTSTFYDWTKAHPEFSDRIEQLRSRPAMTARINMADAIAAGDKDISKWYLEKRVKDFQPKSEVEHSGEIVMKHQALERMEAAIRKGEKRKGGTGGEQ